MCLTNSRLRIWGSTISSPCYTSHSVHGVIGFSVFPHGLSCLDLIIFYFPVGGGVNVTVLHQSLEVTFLQMGPCCISGWPETHATMSYQKLMATSLP